MIIADAAIRERALDITQSFIVQAPAGSGKTELLIQRYLALLAQVEKSPEQIVAITFTRKAAAEMRNRIIACLHLAKNNPKPTEAHQKKTWLLARKVLEREQREAWGLLINPNRLSIKTIDALAASLVVCMPMAARFGMNLKVSDNAIELYKEAAASLLEGIDSDSPWVKHIKRLLVSLDNNFDRAKQLLIKLLSSRDQWMMFGLLSQDKERLFDLLNESVNAVIQNEIEKFKCILQEYKQEKIFKLICFAIKNLQEQHGESKILHCENYKSFPLNHVEHILFWQGIMGLFFTKSGSVRKKLTIKQGFPSFASLKDVQLKQEAKEHKQIASDLLNELAQNRDLSFLCPELLFVPEMSITSEYKTVLNDILILLPLLVAQLHCVFKQSGEVDFIEVMQGANQSLGTEEAPSELALILDYKLQHLLIDEFQDTSLVQWHFLEKLIAGWQGDGQQTLFLVGDPMQSIYAFRQADVSLFSRAQEYGLGNIHLEPLSLQNNFRSTQTIVNWCNKTLSTIFPNQNYLNDGAILFKSSTAVNQSVHSSVQLLHTLANQQSINVVKHIRVMINQYPDQTIGVLVRSRTHLVDLCGQLELAGILFNSVELEPLSHKLYIKDLFSLLKVIMNPLDRFAWLCLLRAPWCGLLLKDLHLIIEKEEQGIWQRLQVVLQEQDLSEDGQIRVRYFIDRFEPIMQYLDRAPMVQLLRLAWHRLEGESYLPIKQNKDHVNEFFNYCLQLERAGKLTDSSLLEEKFQGLFATHKPIENSLVSIMTIHKAKGLEFDTVILPGLERRTPYDQRQLINGCSLTYQDNYYLLLSALEGNNNQSAILRFIQVKNKTRKHYELARLLYVAITRAKKNLVLFATTVDDSLARQSRGSFYELLESAFTHSGKNCEQSPQDLNQLKQIEHYSFVRKKQSLMIKSRVNKPNQLNQNSNLAKDYHWKPEVSKLIGIVFHKIINLYTRSHSIRQRWHEHTGYWKNLLISTGVLPQHLNKAVQIIERCVKNMVNSKQGQWIFAEHQDNACELEKHCMVKDRLMSFRIDRTFIDSTIRWIIDYKVIANEFFNPEEEQLFLHEQKKIYTSQLIKYAELFRLEQEFAIKMALYFPYNDLWIDWDYSDVGILKKTPVNHYCE